VTLSVTENVFRRIAVFSVYWKDAVVHGMTEQVPRNPKLNTDFQAEI